MDVDDAVDVETVGDRDAPLTSFTPVVNAVGSLGNDFHRLTTPVRNYDLELALSVINESNPILNTDAAWRYRPSPT
jgi:hypothetical protein